MRRQRGFTIIELMVVVAIIAIIAALIVGATGRTYGTNATTFSDQLSQIFKYARQRALQTRKIHRVELHLELTPAEIWIYAAVAPGMKRANITPPAARTFVERTIVPKNLTIYHATSTAKSAGIYTNPSGGSPPPQTLTEFDIDFFPNGSADEVSAVGPSDAATIYVMDGGMARLHRVIVYSATGSSYVRTSW